MEYIKSIIYPLDKNKLYHTYIGEIIDVKYSCLRIYFKELPTLPFYVNDIHVSENIYVNSHVLINYKECLTSGDSNPKLIIISIHVIPIINKFNHITLCCLTCGHKLHLIDFKKCKGFISEYNDYDWNSHEDRYSKFCRSCGYDSGPLGSKCRLKIYICQCCYSERIVCD